MYLAGCCGYFRFKVNIFYQEAPLTRYKLQSLRYHIIGPKSKVILLLLLEEARASTGLCVDVSSRVKRDDGRRSSNDPTRSHNNDGRRLHAHSTRRPTTVEADSPSGGCFKQMPNK